MHVFFLGVAWIGAADVNHAAGAGQASIAIKAHAAPLLMKAVLRAALAIDASSSQSHLSPNRLNDD